MLHVMGEARNELTRVDEEDPTSTLPLGAARGPSTPSFDHLVGKAEQPQRHDEFQALRRTLSSGAPQPCRDWQSSCC